jgi:alkylation response protein AidB-like acyl-CoA dehydrogenase
MFISGATAAGVYLVMARTGEQGPKGISAFVVEEVGAELATSCAGPRCCCCCQAHAQLRC